MHVVGAHPDGAGGFPLPQLEAFPDGRAADRIYAVQQSRLKPLPMSRQPNDAVKSFGQRLAQLRKAAGHTQQQLADEVGMSRRMIAYYEGETGRLPTSFLVDLAHALAVSTDELLGIPPMKKSVARRIISARWERRVRQIERLGARPKQQIVTFIDAILTAEQACQGGKF